MEKGIQTNGGSVSSVGGGQKKLVPLTERIIHVPAMNLAEAVRKKSEKGAHLEILELVKIIGEGINDIPEIKDKLDKAAQKFQEKVRSKEGQ